MNQLPYSIAIATRNRLEALKLSIPRMLSQRRAPSQLVVVDSSDNHEPVRELVHFITEKLDIETSVIHGERGITQQRNKALEFVKHPIVFFPDDDSILFPNAASEIMKVYDADNDKRIAAVCAAESNVAPNDFLAITRNSYSMRFSDKVKARTARFRYSMEDWLVPDPAKILGRSFFRPAFKRDDKWCDSIIPVPWMTGFRMTFRTKVIRTCGFCRSFADYSLFEDIAASFAAWEQGAVVAATKAKIFHYRSPEKRGDAMRLGFEQLLNKAYVVARHSPPDHPSRKYILRHARYKTLQYKFASLTGIGKKKHQGAKEALKYLPQIASSKPKDADNLYLAAIGTLVKQCEQKS